MVKLLHCLICLATVEPVAIAPVNSMYTYEKTLGKIFLMGYIISVSQVLLVLWVRICRN